MGMTLACSILLNHKFPHLHLCKDGTDLGIGFRTHTYNSLVVGEEQFHLSLSLLMKPRHLWNLQSWRLSLVHFGLHQQDILDSDSPGIQGYLRPGIPDLNSPQMDNPDLGIPGSRLLDILGMAFPQEIFARDSLVPVRALE